LSKKDLTRSLFPEGQILYAYLHLVPALELTRALLKGKVIVAIIGGWDVGTNAAKIAAGIDAKVTLLDINIERLRYLDDILGGRIITLL
jgi:alanine dehydrogenase